VEGWKLGWSASTLPVSILPIFQSSDLPLFLASEALRASILGMKRSLMLLFFYLAVGAPAAFAAGSGPVSAPQGPIKVPDAATPYNEGVSLMKAKKYAAAQVKFEAALKQNPKMAEAHNNLAFCLRKQSPENFASSLEHYNEAIRLNPKLARAYEYRGVLFVELGRKADAEKDLATLKQLDPKLATALSTAIKAGKDTDY
jgi:tetratricopeptide (TPR) repeat protein